MGSVAVSLVRSVAAELERRGHDVDALLTESGIDAALLDVPNARVELEPYHRLQLLALETTGDPAFGLRMGEHGSIACFGVLGHMVAQCRTLREALDVPLRYYRLVADVVPPSIEEDGDLVRIRYDYLRSDDSRIDRLRAEFGLTRLLRIARELLASAVSPIETWFEHEAPEYADEYARIFGGSERFGRPFTGFVAPRALLEERQPHHDAMILELLKSQADRWLERLDDTSSVTSRVRRLVLDGPPSERPEMEHLAKQLGMSERSLRRKLRSEGVAFHELVEGALGERACAMLRDSSRTIQEAAYELGFADATSFHRAFKRWTGVTPSEYRRAPVRA